MPPSLLSISVPRLLRTLLIVCLLALCLALGWQLTVTKAAGSISLTILGTAATENFDTLANTGTSSTVPTGWDFSEAGTNANTTYSAGTGSSATGDTYSFGAASNTERAFGGLQSGTLTPTIGASFTNNTGATITSLQIAYTGEQWRLGALGRTDRLDFQYSTNATSLTTGTWTDVNALDFTAPMTSGTVGSLDGNLAANRTAISSTITGLTIANGSTVWIRWNSFDATGSDDGLAIDNFSLTPNGATPALSINDVTQTEGNSGMITYSFTVSLDSPAHAGGVTFDIATANNSASAGSDYIAKSSTGQSIAAGSKTATVEVTVNGDTMVEPDETFFVNVTNVSGATVSDGQGLGTITNDDLPTLSINDVMIAEGNGGTTNATFTVTLSSIHNQTVTVNYATANNSASAGSDYAATSGILTFNPNETIKQITVQVMGDLAYEPDETFFVNLTNPMNAGITDAQGQGTISNDDATPTLAINDVSLNEGNAGTTNFVFTVTLTGAAGFAGNITVDYATADDTAMAGNDYTMTSGTLTFAGPIASNSVTQTITVPVKGDTIIEPDKIFFVKLSNASNADIIRAQGTGKIIDDDFNSQLRIGLSDPLVCTGEANTLSVQAEITNPNNAAGNLVFRALLPPQLTGIANTCVFTAGTCTVNQGEIVATGVIAANQTVTIDYKVRVLANTVPGTNLCIDSMATLDGNLMAAVQACTRLNCPAANQIINAQVSAQKAGAVLVFPYYISKAAEKKDTRLSISNVGTAQTYAHIFFIDGTSCNQADQFLCLTPNASVSFKASEYDPEATGWLLAVAVDANGVPVRNNSLIGNAFVQDGNYADNYSAESFAANSPALAAVTTNTATLFFDGSSYDAVPGQFSVEIQSPLDAVGQKIVTVGMSGDLTTGRMTGAAQVGTGLAINGNEKPFASFSAFLSGNCQAIGIINAAHPRVPNSLGTMIPPGQAGTLKFNVGAAVGLLLTPRPATWHGIRALHKTALTTATITMPILRPIC